MAPRSHSTIGVNPLDALVPRRTPAGEGTGADPVLPPPAPPTPRLTKERFTVQLQPRLADRVRDAVFWTPGLTVAALAEQAFEAALRELEDHRGEPFPRRHGPLPPGRPVT